MIGNVNVPGASAADLANKVDKISGKGLSSNDFTDAYKSQLDNINGSTSPYQYITQADYQLITPEADKLYWVIFPSGSHAILKNNKIIEDSGNTVFDLNNTSWEVIDLIARSGNAASYFNIGDTKRIKINGIWKDLYIYDFNHDDVTNGGKAGITFGVLELKEIGYKQVNSTDTNVGSFISSELYTYLHTTIFNSLDERLQAVIKPVDKITGLGNYSGLRADSMKLFPLSVTEYCGSANGGAVGGEGSQYQIFATSSLFYPLEIPSYTWTRSPNNSSNKRWCYVSKNKNYNGFNFGNDPASNGSQMYINFAFCI